MEKRGTVEAPRPLLSLIVAAWRGSDQAILGAYLVDANDPSKHTRAADIRRIRVFESA